MKDVGALYGKDVSAMDKNAHHMFSVIETTLDDQREMMHCAYDKWMMQSVDVDVEGQRKSKEEAIDLGKRIAFMRCARDVYSSEFNSLCVACRGA